MFSKKPGAMTFSAECCRLTDADLDEIEAEAKTNAAETYRGALLALVEEVRRLRGLVLTGPLEQNNEGDHR